ncbi:MAG: HlyD family efflux transporter periplasmic adaptor subunit [Clostridia bacterium]|nr:HlyD family efflux transporter periplasmic adaptor subunit [Clostridia bacterium]
MKKVITVVLAAAFCTFVYFVISYVQAPVSTISAYSVNLEEIVEGNAFIVRKETVYTAEQGGRPYSYAREGARVGNSRRICSVYSGEIDESLLQELGTVNSKITELGSVIVDSSGFMAGGGSVAQRLLQLQEEIEAAAAENDIEKISKCKEEIVLLASGTAAKSNADRLAELTAKRAELESRITNPRQDIYSTEAGIYSAKIDGYENVLSVDTVLDFNVEKFAQIKPEEEEEKEQKDIEGDTLPGEKVCKIIDNHVWYIVTLVERDKLEDLKKGDNVEVRFDKLPGEQVKASVVSVSNEPEGQEKAVVVLKCESFSEGAFSIRATGVEIIRRSYSGFEVPVHAIRVLDGQNGVMVRVGGSDIFKPCKMIYQDENSDKAIIVPDTEDANKELNEYDMIIVGEK